MSTTRNICRSTVAAVAVLAGTAWVTGTGWSEQKAQRASGAHIQMGEGHFNRDGKAFHYWDREKEIPAVCSRCHAANGVPEYLSEGKNSPPARQERIRLHELPRRHALLCASFGRQGDVSQRHQRRQRPQQSEFVHDLPPGPRVRRRASTRRSRP